MVSVRIWFIAMVIYHTLAAVLEWTAALVMSACVVCLFCAAGGDACISATTPKQLLIMSASSCLDSLDALPLRSQWVWGPSACLSLRTLGVRRISVGGLASAEGFGTCVRFQFRSRLGTVVHTGSDAASNSCQVLFITRLFPIAR